MKLLKNFKITNYKFMEYWFINKIAVKDILSHLKNNKIYVIQLVNFSPMEDKEFIISDTYIFERKKISTISFMKFIKDSIKQGPYYYKIFDINFTKVNRLANPKVNILNKTQKTKYL